MCGPIGSYLTFIPYLIRDKFYNLLKPIEWICTHCIFIVFWREYSISTLGTLYALFCSGMGMDECIYKALQTLISSLIKPLARWVCSSKNSLKVLSKYPIHDLDLEKSWNASNILINSQLLRFTHLITIAVFGSSLWLSLLHTQYFNLNCTQPPANEQQHRSAPTCLQAIKLP